ncbi:MAG: TfuA-like protein [Pseudomonadota bacterium]
MSICVFLGPTLSHDAAAGQLDATYLPPIRQGDIMRAIDRHEPHTLAIIDGFFEQTPAVWHKEILWALSHGLNVYGASSMGALRAAELEPFGMVGVGRIFEAYRSGVFAPFEDEPFEDDDEVAVSHGPAELGYPGSVAMVDIRATLDAACQAEVIDPLVRDRLARVAKSIFYKDRSYEELFNRASEDLGSLSEFNHWLMDGGKIHQKSLDAERLLAMISAIDPKPLIAEFNFEHTTVWDAALADLANPDAGD